MQEILNPLALTLEQFTSSGINYIYGDRATNLWSLKDKYSNCTKCNLATTRKNFVYGTGNNKSKLLIIGEAPGAKEDEQGLPFVGRAGMLLTKMLKAIDLDREDVYITNIVKCRPPKNRDPLLEEINACINYLNEQIVLIKPKAILLLGRVSAKTLLNKDISLAQFRAKKYNIMRIRTFVTYHPAALLRHPAWKKETWYDLQKLQKFLNSK